MAGGPYLSYDSAMRFPTVNWRPLGAGLLVTGIWIWVARFVLSAKTAFLDDAFIPLRIARLILKEGTAQFFPISDSSALLASSPLRLLVLLPSTAAAEIIADGPSLNAARVTFFVSGLLGALLFLPFFRERMRYWVIGMGFAGLLSLSTEAALQMEGGLLFWAVYTLLFRLHTGGPPWHTPGRIGLLVGLLTLTRPEFGLVAILPMTLLIGRAERGAGLFRFFVVLMGCAAIWIAIALALGVYPIPSTYLSKFATARMGMFGPGFLRQLPEYISHYFTLGYRMPTPLIVLGSLGLLFLLAWRKLRRLLTAGWLLGSFALLCLGAGNFLWYFENLFIVVLTVLLWVVLERWRPGRMRTYRRYLCMVGLALFFASSLARQRALPWDFGAEHSYAVSYRNIARHHVGHGLFVFPEREPTLLRMSEIGIVGYFCDESLWLCDASGLAQPGNLLLDRARGLVLLYPNWMIRSAAEEYADMLRSNVIFDTVYPTHTVVGELNRARGLQLGDYLPELDLRFSRYFYPAR